MTNKIINSIDDLDDLDLDLEDTNISSVDDELDLDDVSENKEDTSIDDLELDDVVPDEKPTHDLELDDVSENKEDTSIDDLDLDDVVPDEKPTDDLELEDAVPEEIELDLELEVNEQPKAEVKQVETKAKGTPKSEPKAKVTPKSEPKAKVTPKSEVKQAEPKSEPNVEVKQVVSVPENKTEAYLDNAVDMSKINDQHYRFLVKPLNLPNYDKMVEDCIRINGNMINPIQLVIEEGEFRLISGFNTFDVLKKLDVKTTWAIIFSEMNTYQVAKRYITATHHLD